MLLNCYIFEWKPFGILISYLLEVVVLIILFILFRMKDERMNPDSYRKAQPVSNLLYGMIPLVLFQYFIIGWTASFIDPNQNFLKQDLLLSKEIIFPFCTMLFLYFIKAMQISDHVERLQVFQNNFLFKVLGLAGTSVLGFVLVIGLEITSLLPVLTVMVVLRIVLEIYFGRKMKFE